MLIKKSLSNCYNVLLYFLLKYLFAGTLKYKPFVNSSIILLLSISYKGVKLTLKWIFPFFLVISACLKLEIEMYIFSYFNQSRNKLTIQIVIQLIRMHIVFYSACKCILLSGTLQVG